MDPAEAGRPLTDARLAAAVTDLAARDADLAGDRRSASGCRRCGTGARVSRRCCTSSSSSRSRCRPRRPRSTGCALAADPLTPGRFLALADADLLAIGFSRQKARYGRALAAAVETGALDLDGLGGLDDAGGRCGAPGAARDRPWTSTIYLLMVLGRPDVWPVGDIALATSVGEVKGLGHRPDAVEMDVARRGVAAMPVRGRASVLARLPAPARAVRLVDQAGSRRYGAKAFRSPTHCGRSV